jgi:hypothetical protein
LPRRLIARRFVLTAASLVFLAIAIGSLWAPHIMAEPFDYRLPSPNALNEFRAVYVGLWLAQAGVLAWAARRVDLLYLGDVGGLLILGQVVGRILSVLIDGAPDTRLLAPALAELAAGVLILLLRPRSSGRRGTRRRVSARRAPG